MYYFPIKKDNEYLKGSVTFDLYGNLYITVNENTNENTNELTFQININGKNQPYADLGDYHIIDDQTNIKINKFTLLDKESSLKSNVIKNKNIEEVGSDEEYDEEGELIDKNDYYEEDKYVLNDDNDDVDNKSNESDEDENPIFNFSFVNPSCQLKIDNRYNGDITALYDTYLYDNDLLCFKSNAPHNQILYRIKLFSNGNFSLRSIGDRDIFYRLELCVGDGYCINFVRV